MAAVTRAQVSAEMPEELLRKGLDADMDGVEDSGLFDGIVSNAETLCKSRLGSVAVSLPADPSQMPSAYAEAVLASVCAVIARRARLDKDALSIWLERQAQALEILKEIADGSRELFPQASTGSRVKAEPLQFGERGELL